MPDAEQTHKLVFLCGAASPAAGDADASPATGEGAAPATAAGMVARTRAGRAPGARDGGGEEDEDEDVGEDVEDDEEETQRLGRTGATWPAIGASNHLRPCFVARRFSSSRVRSSHHCFLFPAWNGIAAISRRLKRSSNSSSAGSRKDWSI